MKKAVAGLAGIVLSALSFVGAGCQCPFCEENKIKYAIHEEAIKVRYHSKELRKLLKLEPNETLQVFDIGKEGEPLHVAIGGEDGIRPIVYFDLDEDGKYDEMSPIMTPENTDIIIPPKSEKKYKEEN